VPGEVYSMSLLVITIALAHPLGAAGAADPNGGMPGQRIELRVEGGALRVDYYAEVAALRLYKEARAEGASGPSWAMSRAESLRSGVKVRWNGETLPLEPVPVEQAAELKETGYVEFHVAGSAALPANEGTLEVRMDNYPDEASYYAASASIGGEFVVAETSLGRVHDGRLRDNLHGAWRRSDGARLTSIRLRPTRPWEDASAGPLPERLDGLVDWRGWVLPSAAGLGGVGVVALLNASLRRWRRRRRPSRG
jgi:hypothetical protein